MARYPRRGRLFGIIVPRDRKSTRLNSSHLGISYAAFCSKKKELGEREALSLLHRLGQQPVRPLATLVGTELIGPLEVDRNDLVARHEIGDANRSRRRAVQ